MSSTDSTKSVKVTLPKENLTLVKIHNDDLTGLATINSALVDFEHKEIFSWHFTLLMEMDEHGEDGMPSEAEKKILENFEQELDPLLKTDGNALFLARVINDGLQELIYRVYKPEQTDFLMQSIIESENHPRPFDYRIDPDQKWEKADFYFKAVKS